MTDQNRQFLTTLANLGIASHRLDQIRDAARLHRQQLIGTSELYAVIEAADPVSSAGPAPATERDASGSGRAAEAELYVLLRKAGQEPHDAQALIDRHRDEVLRRMAGEAQQAPTDEDVVEAHRLALSWTIGQPETGSCTCGGTFPLRHLHADTHQPADTAQQPKEA